MSNQRSNNNNSRQQQRKARRQEQRRIKQQYMIEQMSKRLHACAINVVTDLYKMIELTITHDKFAETVESNSNNVHATGNNRILTISDVPYEVPDDCDAFVARVNQEFEHAARIASQVTGQPLSHWGVK